MQKSSSLNGKTCLKNVNKQSKTMLSCSSQNWNRSKKKALSSRKYSISTQTYCWIRSTLCSGNSTLNQTKEKMSYGHLLSFKDFSDVWDLQPHSSRTMESSLCSGGTAMELHSSIVLDYCQYLSIWLRWHGHTRDSIRRTLIKLEY